MRATVVLTLDPLPGKDENLKSAKLLNALPADLTHLLLRGDHASLKITTVVMIDRGHDH